MANVQAALDSLQSKKKGKKQKNKNRKIGRNLRWDGIMHTATKYRLDGRRERNKARRAAQRARWLQHRKEKNGTYTASEGNNRTEQVEEVR